MSESAASRPLAVPPRESTHSASPALHHQFEDIEQQHDAGNFGMWVFLATEMLFFGGVFTGYIIYRSLYYSGFAAGSRGLEIDLGAAMMFVEGLIIALLQLATRSTTATLGRPDA